MQQPDAVTTFERYSDDIRHSMRLANREAIRHLHPSIDTPHLLIALVGEPTGLAGALLRQRGLRGRQVRRAVRRAIPRAWSWNFFVKLPLSPAVENVVAFAVNHAVAEKHDSVGTGGILLAMLRHDDRTTALLRSLALDASALETELAKYLHRFMVEAPGQVLNLDPPAEPMARPGGPGG